MKFEVEISEKIQLMMETCNYGDHTLHGVIDFSDQINEKVLKKALDLTLDIFPIISTLYVDKGGKSYWQSTNANTQNYFFIVDDENQFNTFLGSTFNLKEEIQIKVCLLSNKKQKLGIVMNHMIADGADFKKYLYILSETYSKLIDDFNYIPDAKMNYNRGMRKIIKSIPRWQRFKSLINKDKHVKSAQQIYLPFSESSKKQVFFVEKLLPQPEFKLLKRYCKDNGFTINDVLLGTYYRAIARAVNFYNQPFGISIMVDMRRYVNENIPYSLDILYSSAHTQLVIDKDEKFIDTIKKINAYSNKIKHEYMGLRNWVKLWVAEHLRGKEAQYRKMMKSWKWWPLSMSNIGVIDDNKLIFKGSHVKHCWITGAVKYTPYHQFTISTFKDTLNIVSAIKGTNADCSFMQNFQDNLYLDLISNIKLEVGK